jgi:hypothetical protein
MKSNQLAVLLLASLLPLAGACNKNPDAGDNTATGPTDQASQSTSDAVTATTEHEIAGTSNPNDLSPARAQRMIDDVTIGHKLEADGTIAQANQGDDFAPGDPIYLAMKVADAPATSKVKVAWYGPGDAKIDDQEKAVPQGAKYLSFEKSNTRTWAKGDYHAEIWVGDEKVDTQRFNITDKSKAGK